MDPCGREFRFRGDLYCQESTFPLVRSVCMVLSSWLPPSTYQFLTPTIHPHTSLFPPCPRRGTTDTQRTGRSTHGLVVVILIDIVACWVFLQLGERPKLHHQMLSTTSTTTVSIEANYYHHHHHYYRVAQNKIPHQRICNISATSGLILSILEAA